MSNEVKVEGQTGLSKDQGQFPVFPGLRDISTFSGTIPEIPGHLASMGLQAEGEYLKNNCLSFRVRNILVYLFTQYHY